MAYFQQKGVLLSTGQLLALIQSHYTQQALQQAYVLILGLDVLGNPYGLVRDFTQGLGDFFYEPFLVSESGLQDFGHQLMPGIVRVLHMSIKSCTKCISGLALFVREIINTCFDLADLLFLLFSWMLYW